MNRGVMRLSTTLDCWKNSCQGATVVPTMAMISSTASELTPPEMLGTTNDFAACPHCGCDISSIGICASVMAMKTNMARSRRGGGNHGVFRDAEVGGGQADADELGDDRQEVEQEQVADGKPPPAAAEAFVDQPGVSDPGDRAEPDHHFLVDD